MKHFLVLAGLLAILNTGWAQKDSPPETASGKIGNATLDIKYCAPSVTGRKIFGAGGRVMQDPTAPIWRAGANDATAFHTDANLKVGNLTVPKGDYTLYVNVKDPDAWELVINKQTHQWGTNYDASQDLGRVKMDMRKPPALIEMLKYTVSGTGGNKGTLTLAWENHIASVPVTAQ
jgi:opacity protein-like surface antigen